MSTFLDHILTRGDSVDRARATARLFMEDDRTPDQHAAEAASQQAAFETALRALADELGANDPTHDYHADLDRAGVSR